MQRRQFLGTLALAGLTALTGGVNAQQVGLDAGEFTPVPVWSGLADARPAPDSERLSGLEGRVAYLAINTGALSYIDEPGGQWDELPTKLPTVADEDLPDPASVPAGYMVLDKDRGIPAWNDGTGFEFPSFVDDVKTSPTTVANDTTRTQVFNPDINAMSLIEGRDYEITVSGKFSTANNTDTFDVIVDLGGTDVATLTNAGKNVTDAHWRAVTEFSVRPGSGSDVHLAPESYGQFDEQMRGAVHDVVAVDPTVLTNISVDIQWSAADAGNSVTVERGTLQQRG